MGLLRVRLVALAVAIAAVLATGTWFALSRASAQEGAGHSQAAAKRHDAAGQPHTVAAKPLQVVSVSPASRSTGVDGASPVRIVFSAALAAGSPLPTLSPHVAGQWQRISADSLEFVPRAGIRPGDRGQAPDTSRASRTAVGRRRTAGQAGLGSFPDRDVQHSAAPATARATRLPAAELDARRIVRAVGRRCERAAQRGLRRTAWHVHLAGRLPEGAARVLAAWRVEPDGDRGRHGVRV